MGDYDYTEETPLLNKGEGQQEAQAPILQEKAPKKDFEGSLQRNLIGFTLGVFASLFIAVGTACEQVTRN